MWHCFHKYTLYRNTAELFTQEILRILFKLLKFFEKNANIKKKPRVSLKKKLIWHPEIFSLKYSQILVKDQSDTTYNVMPFIMPCFKILLQIQNK